MPPSPAKAQAAPPPKGHRAFRAVRFMNLLPRMNISVQNSMFVLKGGCNAKISCLQNAGKAAEEAGWTTFIRAGYHWTKESHRKN